MALVQRFIPHSDLLRSMDFRTHSSISELVFACRDGEVSLCVVFSNAMALRSLIGDLPAEIEQAQTIRYAVDLESIGTDKLRLYIDGQEDGEVLRGFYFDRNMRKTILKKYRKTDDKAIISIDRYNGAGSLVSGDEPEAASDSSCWTGPQDLLDAALDAQQDHNVIFLSKGDKLQSYIRIMK